MLEKMLNESLKMAFQPEVLKVVNDSASHKGHRESGDSGESHFTVTIVSAAFQGIPLVKRHQSVYTAVRQALEGGVHALSIITLTPEEFLKKK